MKLNQTEPKRRQATGKNSNMTLFLKAIHNLIHSIIQIVLFRGRENYNDSILFMAVRQVATDDDPSMRRSCPVFNPKAIGHERSRADSKVGHVDPSLHGLIFQQD